MNKYRLIILQIILINQKIITGPILSKCRSVKKNNLVKEFNLEDLNNRIHCIDLFIKRKTNISSAEFFKLNNGSNLLYLACQKRQVRIFDFLMNYKIDEDIFNEALELTLKSLFFDAKLTQLKVEDENAVIHIIHQLISFGANYKSENFKNLIREIDKHNVSKSFKKTLLNKLSDFDRINSEFSFNSN